MIGFLHGTAHSSDILLVNGVGYLVAVPGGLEADEVVDLHVVTVIREDAFELYGFRDPLDQSVFRMLCKAPGVGAKTALTMLTTLGCAGVAHALANKDHAALARTPGIGAKSAERICAAVTVPADLLAALAAPEGAHAAAPADGPEDPLVTALTGLGWNPAQAATAAAAARGTCAPDASEDVLLRAAIRAAA